MKHQIVLSAEEIREFQRKVLDHYKCYGRDLPWRNTDDPYRILISEVMLQQTQVGRVMERFEEFICTFPDPRSLAAAPLRDVLELWQGLGYNRRALALKRAAEVLVAHYDGKIPTSPDSLRSLPGIGSVTAHAVCAFAFNEPTVFVETNIRTVFIYHFFQNNREVRDSEILPLVAQTLDHQDPRRWYHALMDYGVALKKKHGNPNRRSTHYRRQPPFKGSNRQIRGLILQELVKRPGISEELLFEAVPFRTGAIKQNLKKLEKEGLIVKKGGHISIA